MDNINTNKDAHTMWVVMGVSGCGKSSIGAALAAQLNVPFVEGDDFHPPENVEKMSAGNPLDDQDRVQWLANLQAEIRTACAASGGVVLSCSALKRRYRDVLREAEPAIRFAHLSGARDLIFARMQSRQGHYMPLSLLDSQLSVLEPLQSDEAGLVLNIDEPPARLVESIFNAI